MDVGLGGENGGGHAASIMPHVPGVVDAVSATQSVLIGLVVGQLLSGAHVVVGAQICAASQSVLIAEVGGLCKNQLTTTTIMLDLEVMQKVFSVTHHCSTSGGRWTAADVTGAR